jgi:hypothetical protein
MVKSSKTTDLKKKKDPKKKQKQKNDPNEISHLSRGNNAN